jgi:hypothetical protein
MPTTAATMIAAQIPGKKRDRLTTRPNRPHRRRSEALPDPSPTDPMSPKGSAWPLTFIGRSSHHSARCDRGFWFRPQRHSCQETLSASDRHGLEATRRVPYHRRRHGATLCEAASCDRCPVGLAAVAAAKSKPAMNRAQHRHVGGIVQVSVQNGDSTVALAPSAAALLIALAACGLLASTVRASRRSEDERPSVPSTYPTT